MTRTQTMMVLRIRYYVKNYGYSADNIIRGTMLQRIAEEVDVMLTEEDVAAIQQEFKM